MKAEEEKRPYGQAPAIYWCLLVLLARLEEAVDAQVERASLCWEAPGGRVLGGLSKLGLVKEGFGQADGTGALIESGLVGREFHLLTDSLGPPPQGRPKRQEGLEEFQEPTGEWVIGLTMGSFVEQDTMALGGREAMVVLGQENNRSRPSDGHAR